MMTADLREVSCFLYKKINALSWDENGLRYNILIDDLSLKLNQAIQLIGEMKLSSNQ